MDFMSCFHAARAGGTPSKWISHTGLWTQLLLTVVVGITGEEMLKSCLLCLKNQTGSPARVNAHFSAARTKGRRTREFPVFAVNKAMRHSWGHLAVLFYIFFRHKNTVFFSLAPLGALETCSDGSASAGLASSFRGLFPLKLQVFINSRWVSSLRKRRKARWGNQLQASFFFLFVFFYCLATSSVTSGRKKKKSDHL